MSTPNEELEDTRADLEVAISRIAELENALAESGSGELQRRLELTTESLRQSDARIADLSEELERMQLQNEQLQDGAVRAEQQRRDAVLANEQSSDMVVRLEQTVAKLNDDLIRERAKAQDAASAGARAVSDRSWHNDQLEKAVSEAQELRDEVQTLEVDLEAYKDAVAELKSHLDQAGTDNSALEEALAEARSLVIKLDGEIAEERAKADALQSALAGKDTEIKGLLSQMEDANRRAMADVAAANERTAASERSVATLQTEIRGLKAATRVQELEEEVTKLKEAHTAVTSQRDSAALLLEETMAKLTNERTAREELVEDSSSATNDALGVERRRAVDATDALALERAALGEAQAHIASLTEHKAAVERSLAEARRRLQEYEAGYNLTSAIEEQERLREAIRLRDADIARLTASVAEYVDVLDMCEEIARRLAERAGVGSTGGGAVIDIWAIYPEDDVRVTIRSTIERLRASNLEYVRQNSALEESRAVQLRQLRVHAEQTGDKGLKYYGLSAAQLILANEFAENLRRGSLELPVNDRTLELQEELRRAKSELEDAREQLYAARAAARAGAPSSGNSAGSGSMIPSLTIIANAPPPPQPPIPAHLSEKDEAMLRAARTAQARAEAEVAGLRAALQQQQRAASTGLSSPLPPGLLEELRAENTRLAADLRTMAAAQDARFEALQRDRAAEMLILREGEVARLAQLRENAAYMGAPHPHTGSLGGDDLLEKAFALLRSKLDEGGGGGGLSPLSPFDLALLYRAFAHMISAAEEAGGQLEMAREARETAEAAAREARERLADLRIAHERQSGEFNAMVRSLAARGGGGGEEEGGGGGIRTPAGLALLQKNLEGLLLRSSSSSSSSLSVDGDASAPPSQEEMVQAHTALVEALEELSAKNTLVDNLRDTIAGYEERCDVLAAQHTELFRARAAEMVASREALAASERAAQEALAKCEGLSAKAARLDELTSTLSAAAAASAAGDSMEASSSSPHPPTSTAGAVILAEHAKKLTRQLAAMEIAHPALVRRYNLLSAEVAAARDAARTAELASLESEGHARQRILYLELWKKGAAERLSRLTALAEEWVPRETYETVLASRDAAAAAAAEALAAEGALRAELLGAGGLRAAQDRVSALEGELAQALVSLQEEAARAAVAQEAAANAIAALESFSASQLPTSTGGSSAHFQTSFSSSSSIPLPSSTASVLAAASKPELLIALTRQKAACAEAQVAAAAAGKRASLSSERLATIEGALHAATARCGALEESLAAARASASAAGEEAAQARALLAGGGGGRPPKRPPLPPACASPP